MTGAREVQLDPPEVGEDLSKTVTGPWEVLLDPPEFGEDLSEGVTGLLRSFLILPRMERIYRRL